MSKSDGVSALVLAVFLCGSSLASAASPATALTPAGRPSAPRAPAAPAPSAPDRNDGPAATTPPVLSQDAAARSRMHECGHQWSTMKKAGTVGTLTWKEFSATCLVVSR